ncbi:hypothetical protein NC651_018693 [Populus alba x Populus x berolinensis]|nr:hypothetical protein NC651_018693 [Populus alba x Populus x berolinensis]
MPCFYLKVFFFLILYCSLNMSQMCTALCDIFDERHFITTLQDDVRIAKALPKELVSIPRARKHFTSWSGMGYYEEMA